jgi:DNA-binding NtrC family response regulator
MGKRAILCVDDEILVLISLIQELKDRFKYRYIYEQATDAFAALQTIDSLVNSGIEVIFIITDWLMPGMMGDEFLEHIAKSYPSIKSIMITGQADEEALVRVRTNQSVIGVFGKPWDSAELFQIIEQADPRPEDTPR